jgi:hypothetical protein
MNAQTADVRVGDIWQEQYPHSTRFVRVARVRSDAALIYKVVKVSSGEWVPARRSPERWARLDRFNGKPGGYALHQRVNE